MFHEKEGFRVCSKHTEWCINWAKSDGYAPPCLARNDGIVSMCSLILGVAASHATYQGILGAGVAGLVAGAMSMATGEIRF
jgi:hypothetical protein